MRRLLMERVPRWVAVGLCAIAFAVSGASADDDATVTSREDIATQLGFAQERGIQPTAALVPRIGLSAIQFEFNSDRLTEAAQAQVAELAAALRFPSLEGFSFGVVGHTDSVGGSTYNRDLSLRRARSVKHYLVALGVREERLLEVGLGEDYPVAGTAGDDPRNRRVEVLNLGTHMAASSNIGFESRTEERFSGRALLIGIDRYQYVSPLVGTVNDVRQMESYVSSHLGFNDQDVRLLLDEDATRDNIMAAIRDWLIDGTEQGDDVLLYYSGHGFQQPDENADEADRLDETLVPVDVTIDVDGIPQGMITDDEVAILLAQLTGRRVHVVIDACHSGTLDRLAFADAGTESWQYVKSPRGPDGAPLRIGLPATDTTTVTRQSKGEEGFVSTKDPDISRLDITVWTAVRADQKALVDEELTSEFGSVFTRRLLWGVRDGKADANTDGIISRSELHAYLVRESEAYCERNRHRCDNGLTPQLHSEVGGAQRVAFARMPSSPSLETSTASSKDILVRQAERLVAPNDVDVQLEIAPGTSLSLGSSAEIVVESTRDGYLILLDIDPSGRMVQIYPNAFSEQNGMSNRVQAGQSLLIPGARGGFRFVVAPPVGSGILVAVVAEESLQLSGLTSRHKDLAVVERPDAYILELHEALRGAGDADWARATLEYEVVVAQ